MHAHFGTLVLVTRRARNVVADVQSGMSVWHQNTNPEGKVVELHGNAGYLLCPHCERITEAKASDLLHLKKCRPRVCSACHQGELRFKIMLYDDEEASLITPEDVWNQFEADLEQADLLIWVGVSFEQVRCRPSWLM